MATTRESETPAVDDLVSRIDDGAFEDWYRERDFRQNVQQGKHYFNGSSRVPDPERHAPGSLLQCHRKRYYAQLNAPKESGPPRGIFWFGSTFEERVVIEFLRDVAESAGAYVQNDASTIRASAGSVAAAWPTWKPTKTIRATASPASGGSGKTRLLDGFTDIAFADRMS